MSDLRQQIQKHYDAQALSAERVDAIVVEGRAAALEGEKIVTMPQQHAGLWRMGWAVAAALVLFAGLSALRPWEPMRLSYVMMAPRIVDFFATPPELPKRSQSPEELRTWLLAQGAPSNFQIPAKLRGLKSFGCQVVDVHGHPAYLTCFWSEKKPGVDDGSLVHLFVAKRSEFRDAPTSATPVYRELSGWSFAAWTDGDVVYTMAAAAPMEQLRKFVAQAHDPEREGLVAAETRKRRSLSL